MRSLFIIVVVCSSAVTLASVYTSRSRRSFVGMMMLARGIASDLATNGTNGHE